MSIPQDSSFTDATSTACVGAGDYELNLAGVCGAPTLRPAPGLERRLCLQNNNSETIKNPLTLGVHLHAYYLPEFRCILDALRQCMPSCDLLITTDCMDKKQLIEAVLTESDTASWSKRLEVRVVPNRGRNVIPLLGDGLSFLAPCELALHLHTKRTTHKSFGADWFKDLLTDLVGSAQRVKTVVQAFSADPGLGVVMPQPRELIRPYLNWGANFDIAALMVLTLWPTRRLDIQAPLVFPPGMMFWFRPEALNPLAQALAFLEPRPIEPLLHDGTPLHALERLVAHSCEEAGMHWALLKNATDVTQTPTSPPQRLSVWEPQSGTYLEGVAALAQRQRELFTTLILIAQQRDSLQETILQLEDRIQALEQSRSWRITAPLRRLANLVA